MSRVCGRRKEVTSSLLLGTELHFARLISCYVLMLRDGNRIVIFGRSRCIININWEIVLGYSLVVASNLHYLVNCGYFSNGSKGYHVIHVGSENLKRNIDKEIDKGKPFQEDGWHFWINADDKEKEMPSAIFNIKTLFFVNLGTINSYSL